MSVILWGLTKGDYLRTLLSHKREVVSLEFSGDGVLLASSSSDDRAIVWDVASGNVLHVLGPHSGCGRVLAFSEDRRHLTTASSQETNVWELNSEELVESRERETQVNSAQKRPYNAFTFSDFDRLQRALQQPVQPEQPLEQPTPRLRSQVTPMSSRLLPAARSPSLPTARSPPQAQEAWAQEWAQAARDNDNAKWAAKYLGWRLPPGYGADTTIVVQDRVVLLCKDGRVLILDISRMD